ncbi:MAG: hypothetical protein QXG00_00795 [Candidatus Woesearchaeota archaeon]
MRIKKTGKNQPKVLNEESQKEKIPIFGFIGFIDIFLLLCGSLTVIFGIINQFQQSALFLVIGLLFYFARKKLEKIYVQEAMINIETVSKFLCLGLGPLFLIFAKIISLSPDSVFIFIPIMVAFTGSAINASKKKAKINLAVYAILLLLIFIFLNYSIINEVFASLLLFILGVILFL